MSSAPMFKAALSLNGVDANFILVVPKNNKKYLIRLHSIHFIFGKTVTVRTVEGQCCWWLLYSIVIFSGLEQTHCAHVVLRF